MLPVTNALDDYYLEYITPKNELEPESLFAHRFMNFAFQKRFEKEKQEKQMFQP